MKLRCEVSGESFELDEEDRKYRTENGLPLPKLSPPERQRRRLSFRNQRHLYRRKCDATGASIITIFTPEYRGPVFSLDSWWSDKWDPHAYQRPIDFSRPFFEQFAELFLSVPQPAAMVNSSENCQYNAYCALSKNCYLCQSSAGSENVYYTYGPSECRDSMDCHDIDGSELCYEVLFGNKCYDVHESKNVSGCRESRFLLNCRNCNNCFFCTNLRNAEFCYKNEKLSKQAYAEKIRQYDALPWDERLELRAQFWASASKEPVPAIWGTMNENVQGNYIFNSKNVRHAFDIHGSEDIRYASRLRSASNTFDADFVYQGEELFEFTSGNKPARCQFSTSIYDGCSDLEYCSTCVASSHDLFGCVGLRHAEYCILNQQYSKEEYQRLRAALIQHMEKTREWGEFFPSRISPFPYNDTAAQDLFPLTPEQVSARGLNWTDREPEERRPGVSPKLLPVSGSDADQTILAQVFACENCRKSYKLQAAESGLAAKLRAPLPHWCFECRYQERLARIEPQKLFSRECSGCGAAMVTSFAPERTEKVLCEKCYLAKVN